jgi:hypothetical protein
MKLVCNCKNPKIALHPMYLIRYCTICNNEVKPKHGGRRVNAGRKREYKEETQTISFRVPKSLIEPINKYVKRALAKSKK